MAIITREDRIPYKRTKIDKHLVKGFERDDFALHPEGWYENMGINLLLNTDVVSLDPDAKTLELAGGETIGWGKLLLATGASPRSSGVPGAVTLRSAADAEEARLEMLELMDQGEKGKVLVIGGGVQAVEMADQALQLGLTVSLAFREKLIMERRLPPALAQRITDTARSQGIEIISEKESFEDLASKVDLILESVGVVSEITLAKRAGLKVGRGILVDPSLRTSHADIYAAGDCAELPGESIAELWHAADDQGSLAGYSMAGRAVSVSHQLYRLKCEVFDQYYFSMGVKSGNGEMTVKDDIQAHWYLEEDRVVGVAMFGDKSRAKSYEKIVNQEWTFDRALDFFNRNIEQ